VDKGPRLDWFLRSILTNVKAAPAEDAYRWVRSNYSPRSTAVLALMLRATRFPRPVRV